MKLKLVPFLLLGSVSLIWAARIIIFNPANGIIQDYRPSEEPSNWEGKSNALVNPVLPPTFDVTNGNNKLAFHVVDGSNVVEFTAFEKEALAHASRVASTNQTRASATNNMGAFTAEQLRERATLETLVQHLNLMRARINMGITNPAAFTNSQPFNMLTLQVFNFQIRQKIGDGSVDEVPGF